MQELNKETQEWDDKFGIIDKHCGFQTEDKQCGYVMPDSMIGCTMVGNETKCAAYVPNIMKPIANVVIEGVGEDAEVVTNAAGGKQSKSPMAMHLVDPEFLDRWFNIDEHQDDVIANITDFMRTGASDFLIHAIFELHQIDYAGFDSDHAIVIIAKVLQEGATKYKPNNWRLIPQEEHINHALIHYMAHKLGDTQDAHLEHCMCRLMMAYATEKSEGFDYIQYLN